MTATELTQPRYIERIAVEGLFGQFDYELGFGASKPEHPNLLLFYGENGTGKTTLLNILYHLLNREPKRGHRSFLARQQFKRVAVKFTDGLEISATRDGAVTGSFILTLLEQESTPQRFAYVVGDDGEIPAAVSDDPVHSDFSKNLPEFNFGFLPHDRSTKVNRETRRVGRPGYRESSRVPAIRHSITNAIAIARQQAIRASNQGQLSVNAIYAELIHQIAEFPLTPPTEGGEPTRFTLLDRLQKQADLVRDYSKFGLISELQVSGLLESLRTMPPNRFYMVDKVLDPFLRGNEARLEALNALHIALTTTVDTVNSLYLNKKISLHLEKGLTITTVNGEPLYPEQLSSGEQELLILFCEVISALKPNTILFIDEPELSLNVSWQRTLLSALLKCASGSTVQFVIATHSIELLAQYRANVARLTSTTLPKQPTPVVAQQAP